MAASSNRIDVDVTVTLFDKQYLESLKSDFSNYDSDGNGVLDKKEFTLWLVHGGTPKKQAKNVFEIADVDGNGTLSFEEFREFATISANIVLHGNLDDYIRMVFKAVDKKNTKHLTKKQFKKFMKLMNQPVGFLKAGSVFRKYDEDKSGTIEFNEISKIMNFRLNESLK